MYTLKRIDSLQVAVCATAAVSCYSIPLIDSPGTPSVSLACLLSNYFVSLYPVLYSASKIDAIPNKSNCFSGNLFPLDTLFKSVDHISFLGAACVFRLSRSRDSEKGFEDACTAADAILTLRTSTTDSELYSPAAGGSIVWRC